MSKEEHRSDKKDTSRSKPKVYLQINTPDMFLGITFTEQAVTCNKAMYYAWYLVDWFITSLILQQMFPIYTGVQYWLCCDKSLPALRKPFPVQSTLCSIGHAQATFLAEWKLCLMLMNQLISCQMLTVDYREGEMLYLMISKSDLLLIAIFVNLGCMQ